MKPKKCPFCGKKLIRKDEWYPAGNVAAYLHPINGCILANELFCENGIPDEKKSIKRWNNRK